MDNIHAYYKIHQEFSISIGISCVHIYFQIVYVHHTASNNGRISELTEKEVKGSGSGLI
jgi:hypothetical protein